MIQNYVSVVKSPRVAEECDFYIHSDPDCLESEVKYTRPFLNSMAPQHFKFLHPFPLFPEQPSPTLIMPFLNQEGSSLNFLTLFPLFLFFEEFPSSTMDPPSDGLSI
ncbi:hypothetical protein TNCV_2496261 [Trichonephila clavipes]|nr:hypothetical protein TNCV_2496261 [Trichonephila clavipes]